MATIRYSPTTPNLTTLTPKRVFGDSALFAETFLRVLDKDGRLIRLRFNHAQRSYLANRTRRDLILKARQLGMSTVIQAEFFRLATTETAITATLAHEDETTQKLRRMADRFYNYLPADFRPTRKYSNDRLTTYPDFDSECVIATAGNKNTGRGGSYTHIHASEIAFWKDARALMAGLMQGGNPAIVLESTPNGAQGYFYNLCVEALDGSRDWVLHFYPWWLDPAYRVALETGETLDYTDEEAALVAQGLTAEQIKWRRAKQRELKALFIQEYPEDPRTCFLRSGTGYFGDLSDVFKAVHNVQPDDAHRYMAGLDWGQSEDYTVLSVIDATANQQVELLRMRQLPWKTMRSRIANVCRRWNVRVLWAETNSMGSTNIEALQEELARLASAAITPEDTRTQVRSFTTTADSKFRVMSMLHDALHDGGLRLLPDPAQIAEFNAFQAVQTPTGKWSLAAAAGEHDDTVIATALANYGRLHGGTVVSFA